MCFCNGTIIAPYIIIYLATCFLYSTYMGIVWIVVLDVDYVYWEHMVTTATQMKIGTQLIITFGAYIETYFCIAEDNVLHIPQ